MLVQHLGCGFVSVESAGRSVDSAIGVSATGDVNDLSFDQVRQLYLLNLGQRTNRIHNLEERRTRATMEKGSPMQVEQGGAAQYSIGRHHAHES